MDTETEVGEQVNAKSDYIAVFDSGVGGISVLRELVRLMPRENFLYFGDSANAPYGTRTPEQVLQLTVDAADALMQRGLKALVIACNTATAVAIHALRSRYQDTIVIGIEPALKVAADRYPTGHIGVMATPVTLGQEKLAQQLERFPNVQVSLIPAPGLVELIESGETDGPAVQALLEAILTPYTGKLDALVLGCTHYPFVKDAVAKILGNTVLLDGGEGTARETLRRLTQADLLFDGPGQVLIENSAQDAAILQLSMELLKDI